MDVCLLLSLVIPAGHISIKMVVLSWDWQDWRRGPWCDNVRLPVIFPLARDMSACPWYVRLPVIYPLIHGMSRLRLDCLFQRMGSIIIHEFYDYKYVITSSNRYVSQADGKYQYISWGRSSPAVDVYQLTTMMKPRADAGIQ